LYWNNDLPFIFNFIKKEKVMTTNFKFGDSIKVIKGFFEGATGYIEDMDDNWVYAHITKTINSHTIIQASKWLDISQIEKE
jgi:transcription antitermination factor NusG